MSGIEIAGLVLGCLPLLIQGTFDFSCSRKGLANSYTGIESYNEGLDPIKSFMRWDKELPQCIRKLRNQHVHYSQTIRILLEPITADVELAEMMTDPGSLQLWKDKEMALKLQERLQESYHAYQGTIGDIERITKQIASKLDLDRANQVRCKAGACGQNSVPLSTYKELCGVLSFITGPCSIYVGGHLPLHYADIPQLKRNDLEALLVANPKKGNDKFEFTKRIRFGMSKKTIKALLEELNDCNRELERFTEKSEKIETYRKAAKPSFATRLQRIQGYAKNVHSSLRWSCSCKDTHRTSLQLEPRGNLYASGMKISNPSKICFTVSFSSRKADTNAPWLWQAAEISVDEDDMSPTPLSSPKPR